MTRGIDSLRRHLLPLFVLLAAVFLPLPAEAGVTLTPRYDKGTTTITEGEDYVYFGKYDHREVSYNGSKETSPTPILWRVMELNTHDTNKSGAILLSHYLLEAMAYQSESRDNGATDQNKWEGSEVHTWLNSQATERVMLGVDRQYDDVFMGFLHDDYFTSLEKSMMLDYPYDANGEGELTPAAGKKIVSPSGEYAGGLGDEYSLYEIATWFERDKSTSNDNTRKADFKGGRSSFTAGVGDGWYYVLRSPTPTSSSDVEVVDNQGQVVSNAVDNLMLAVRPAFFLNLESVILKSKSSDVFGSNSAAEGGSIDNPFILFLPNESKHGHPKFVSADITPASADIDGNTLTLTFGTNISPAIQSWPYAADFTLNRSSGGIHPTNVTGADSNKLVLTFPQPVTAGETVTLDYNLNYDAVSFDFAAGSPGTATVMASSSDIAVTNLTPDPTKTPIDIDGDGEGIASVTVSGNTLTISWLEEGKADTTYDLNQYSVTITYGANRFTVELTPNGELVVTGDGELFPDGTIVVLTATDAADTGTTRGASYTLGEAPAVITGGNCVFTFPTGQISKLPDGIYDLKFATRSGANPAFSGTFAFGYSHKAAASSGSGGGVGCATGAGALALLALGACVMRRRKF